MHNVEAALRDIGIDMKAELLALSHSPDVADLFNGLHGEYLQRRFFVQHSNLVVGMYTVHVELHVLKKYLNV